MSILFESAKIGNLNLPNRFVRSATYDSMAGKSGQVTDSQVDLYAELAEGGAGLIVAAAAYVDFTGSFTPNQNSIASDDCVANYRVLTDAVHKTGAKIALQLFHAGREAATRLRRKPEQALAPSVVLNDPRFSEECVEINEEQLWSVIHSFGDAARRAREAGFDAVQVHGAHGYLLSQFLSPATNRREDDWGSSLQNRVRLHREIYRDIRNKLGQDYPVLIKIGVQDGFPGGLQSAEGIQAAGLLAKEGYDALEISLGLRGDRYDGFEFHAKIQRRDQEAYFREQCRQISGDVGIPVIMVGGMKSIDLMEEVVQNGEAAFVSLCRLLIREPAIINDWKAGNRRKPECISCNKCYEALLKGEKLYCPQRERQLQ